MFRAPGTCRYQRQRDCVLGNRQGPMVSQLVLRTTIPFSEFTAVSNPEKTSKKVIMNSPTKCSHNSSPVGEGIGRNSTKVLCAIRDDLDSEMSDRSLLSVGNWSPRLRSQTRAVAQSVVCVTVKLAALVLTGRCSHHNPKCKIGQHFLWVMVVRCGE